MTLPLDSAFWAHGRLGPYVLTRFNVQEEEVAPGAKVEVFVDGIWLWQRPKSTFARSVEEARDFLSLVVAAYAVRTGVALDFAFGGWVEATKARFEGTIVGTSVDRRGHRPKMDEDGRRSVDMRAAVRLAAATFERGGWRLAVRDVYTAQLALARQSDDCFVFAYRAIEDLAHAVSTTGRKSWPDLNLHLGTTKPALMARTRRLFDARNLVAHGQADHPDVPTGIARARLVGVGRSIVREAISKAPYLPTS